ncbi:hypothetical protein PDESU_02271 [Pontiella desulfatans]|uniref:Uncharacterized protein n=1 Tax=Pontiella desulfatans TaxID=2750659 RepID=A0A6C2U246_PONDE|nr:hypothetical protein [Pontiella desulfatans]VGO13714.1 hypothetical protein PDESU_02271 [Pontiella desulfatans]
MTSFLTLFIAALIFVGIPLALLATINAMRKKQPGCSGNHDCVVYKGEKVQCPSCELREFKAQLDVQKQSA